MKKTTKIYKDIPADCPHYVSNQPVRFARGFTNFKKRMYPDQYVLASGAVSAKRYSSTS